MISDDLWHAAHRRLANERARMTKAGKGFVGVGKCSLRRDLESQYLLKGVA
jgi:hypothetical protein